MFSKHILAFTRTLEGLRSFVDLLEPYLDKSGRSVRKKHADTITQVIEALMSSHPTVVKSLGISGSKPLPSFVEDIQVHENKKGSEITISFKASGPKARVFEKAVTEVEQANERIPLLYQNSLVSLISAVESFLSQVIHSYYDYVPESISDDNKVFSFDDLRHFDSVEDARASLIERKVTDLMRGSFSDWVDFFKKRPKLSMSYLDPYMDTLVETCERRNLLIHNAGIVNSIYLSKVSPNLRKGKKKGAKINSTRKYLDERIDFFELYGILIVAELWKKLKPADCNRAVILSDMCDNHVLQSRWTIAEGLGKFMMQDKDMDESSLINGKLNYWQSVKRQGRWADIKAEVDAQDFSAKGRRFQLAHHSLTGKKQEFYDLVPAALNGNEITLEELRESPIFEEMRRARGFAKYRPAVSKRASGKKPPPTKKSARVKKKAPSKKKVPRRKTARVKKATNRKHT